MKIGYSNLFIYCCFVLLIQSCTPDYTKDLGGGYFYRDEGGNIKDILCEKPNGGEIPATILDYAYNSEFIIAKQKPKLPQEPLYKKDYVYNTDNTFFYWIIVKANNIVIGPLDMQGYINMRLKYQVPDKLILKK